MREDATVRVGYIFEGLYDFSKGSCLLFYELLLFIAVTETKDVKPVLTVKTERDEIPFTSHHEGRWLEKSPKQETITRGWCFIKGIFELS